ncbi:acyl-CoA dehydrogenase family protein [Phenylobacterium sp. J367]|uniref:acyl-CoA dehydrogenase family protein n=1 Tax=Phenylobacterium sp. J367 TaxID=2898435 RepID=UPI002151CCF6|nr:acyl-CoA dehydrogenase family protein [Phenylobacterium sp. J367]MCR5881025.1 acyl-CoA dehydrogenase family protein [Phenylobacterium sp. J367]
MRFALSEDQRILQASLGRALAELSPLDRVRRFADGGEQTAPDIWRGLAELGLPGLLVPGSTAAWAWASWRPPWPRRPWAQRWRRRRSWGPSWAPLALRGGTAEQRARWLPKLAGGEATAGVAISEVVAGARDGAGVTAEGGRLTGKALFVIDAPGAHLLIVADRTGALHLVETPPAPVEMPNIDATRRLSELVFDGTPAEPLGGNDGLARLRDAAWVLLAADSLGAGQVMLDKAVAYAKERKQFGRVIGSFQAVKHLCAEMAAELEPARALVWYAAYAFDNPGDVAPEEATVMAAHAKAHLSEIGRFVARTSTEVHGGIGMTDLLGLHYWFKRIGLNRQLLGGPERVREAAARAQGLVAA